MFLAQNRWCVTAFRLTSSEEPAVWVNDLTEIDGAANVLLGIPGSAFRLSAHEDGTIQLERS